jgi:hypothetical protein
MPRTFLGAIAAACKADPTLMALVSGGVNVGQGDPRDADKGPNVSLTDVADPTTGLNTRYGRVKAPIVQASIAASMRDGGSAATEAIAERLDQLFRPGVAIPLDRGTVEYAECVSDRLLPRDILAPQGTRDFIRVVEIAGIVHLPP